MDSFEGQPLTPVRPALTGRFARVRRVAPLAVLPVAPVQAVWLQRTVPRFVDADGRSGVAGEGGRRLKVVVLGDSVAAGYAVAHHRSTVAGALAARLAQRYAATVTWEVVATTGFTAGEAAGLVEPSVFADADLVFISIGVNDAKNLHSARRFRREIGALLDRVLAAAPHARVALLGIPPLHQLPVVPRPLADALGWRGRVFDALGAAAVAARPRTLRIVPAAYLAHEMFAGDGFHPSELLHAMFAAAVMRELDRTGGLVAAS
ncbi:MAG: SGNH/GDSL hydrolase family protein [Actinobacteria bacterium]|nr:SGNH/GDSL hydrolase family protein [Actinomycetota bacterium]